MRGNNGIQICNGPISRLPKDVVVEILVRISSVKTIALCKSVCKSWRGLISDPRFAELHLARSKICLLVRNMVKDRTLRTVCLLEDEDGCCGFHSGHCVCIGTTEKCEICRSDATTITKLKIPVGLMWAKTIANTCDGLLCMYSYHCAYMEYSPILICNPVTSEFVTLPDWDHQHQVKFRVYGLGIDPKTGRYKVVMLYSLLTSNSESLVVLKAFVHVLGTNSWRELDTPDISLKLDRHLSGPTLLDGALYWVYVDESHESFGMVSFDLDSEQLRYRSLPSFPLRCGLMPSNLALVALGDRLCVYERFSCHLGKLVMCVIDERSVSDSLPEWILHDLSEVRDSMQLICSLNSGALLMYSGNELIYYDPPQGIPRFKRLRFADRNGLEVVAYTPSFVSPRIF